MKKCRKCGEEKLHCAKGLCNTCYSRQCERPIINCESCGEEKPHSAKGMCRECYQRKWREENPNYYHQYYQENKEEILARGRKYYKENKEKIAAYHRQYREGQRNDLLDYQREYYQGHKEEHAAYQRQWREDNQEKHREYQFQRRARKLNATLGPVDEQAVYNLYDNTCLYCGSKEGDLTIDHVVPLNGGGSHCQENLVVACRSCNCSKKDKLLEEWIQTRPDLQVWVM